MAQVEEDLAVDLLDQLMPLQHLAFVSQEAAAEVVDQQLAAMVVLEVQEGIPPLVVEEVARVQMQPEPLRLEELERMVLL